MRGVRRATKGPWMRVSIQDMMDRSGVRFGTSGARGLVAAMTDAVCYAYTAGFLQYVAATDPQDAGPQAVAVGGDLRPSTDRIMTAVLRAASDCGYRPIACGHLPSPALALYGLTRRIPTVMVTGSHIPADRNGLKFTKRQGEILKDDEIAIRQQVIELDETQWDAAGAFRSPPSIAWPTEPAAEQEYLQRYLGCFPLDALAGLRIGVYQHSAVARHLLVHLLTTLGAEVVPLGFADTFVPVDTEAIRPEDVALARAWVQEHRLDSVVSTDGDSDRPLVSDERGEWLRGDVAGILCARYLQADSVSTPVSSNTALERCGWFPDIRRTRIGSPFVVAAMQEAAAAGAQRVVAYEANGGFLVHSDLTVAGRRLRALPTRDAVILILGVLLLARREGVALSRLVASLPPRHTASGLLRPCPPDRAQALLARFTSGDPARDLRSLADAFGAECGEVERVDRTDGLRVTFRNDEIIHLRPSGNAPEFRCYNEAATPERAAALNQRCLELLRRWLA